MDNKAEVPAKWLDWLKGEIEDWTGEGIIEEDQAAALWARYRQIYEAQEKESGGKLVTALAVIGAVLLGVGVILFFAANWQVMSKWLKLGIVFGSIIAAYGTGYYLAFAKENYPRVGRALIFLGTVLYGAGIWLIAQIFHISSHYPNGVLFWAAGILPIVLICRSSSVLMEASLLLTLWTILERTGFENTNYLYLVFFGVSMFLAYRLNNRLAVGLTLPGLVIWVALAVISADSVERRIPFILLLLSLVGLMIYSSGILHKKWRQDAGMQLPYYIVGLLTFILALYMSTFRVFVSGNWLFGGGKLQSPFGISAFYTGCYIIVFMAVLATGLYLVVKNNGTKSLIKEGAFIIAAAAVLLVITIAAPFINDVVYLISTNLFLFITIVTLIIIGYTIKEPVLVNFGLLFFVLDVIARYFDFFWDMLDKSVFFMLGGLLLLVGGTLLERNRRKIVREMRMNDYAA